MAPRPIFLRHFPILVPENRERNCPQNRKLAPKPLFLSHLPIFRYSSYLLDEAKPIFFLNFFALQGRRSATYCVGVKLVDLLSHAYRPVQLCILLVAFLAQDLSQDRSETGIGRQFLCERFCPVKSREYPRSTVAATALSGTCRVPASS